MKNPHSPQKIRITTYSLNKNWHTDNSSQEKLSFRSGAVEKAKEDAQDLLEQKIESNSKEFK